VEPVLAFPFCWRVALLSSFFWGACCCCCLEEEEESFLSLLPWAGGLPSARLGCSSASCLLLLFWCRVFITKH